MKLLRSHYFGALVAGIVILLDVRASWQNWRARRSGVAA